MYQLYEPRDVQQAREEWGANCGPCSLAAVLGLAVRDVQSLFGEWPGYTTPTAMQAALQRAGIRFVTSKIPKHLPSVAHIFLTGPWSAPGVPKGAAYKRSHWVGLCYDDDEPMVYDVNGTAQQGQRGGWMPEDYWHSNVLPMLVASHKGATGGYSGNVTIGVEV